MNRSILRISVGCLAAAVLFAASLRAHDSWLITDSIAVQVGDKVWLSFVTGEVFPYGEQATHPDRVEKFVDRHGERTVDVTGFAPRDKGLSVRHPVEGEGLHVFGCALKPRLIEMKPDNFEKYLTSEEATAALARFLAQRRQSTANEIIVEEYTKFAKTIVEVGAAGDDRTFERPLGHRLEIIPLTNPCQWREGQTVQIRVLLDGHPWSDVPICVGREGVDPALKAEVIAAPKAPQPPAVQSEPKVIAPDAPDDVPPRKSGPFSIARDDAAATEPKPVEPARPEPVAVQLTRPEPQDDEHHYIRRTRTDAQGLASIKLDQPGHLFIKAHFIRPIASLGKAKWESFWASLTFRVAGSGGSVNRDLQSLRGLRGDLTPGTVLGYRMGLAALSELDLQRGDDALLVSHACPLREEYASILDGIQAATGASIGKLSLRLESVDSSAQMRTVFVDRRTRRVLTMQCTGDAISILAMKHPDDFEREATALRLATMSQHSLFQADADDVAVTQSGDNRRDNLDLPPETAAEARDAGFSNTAVGMRPRQISDASVLSE